MQGFRDTEAIDPERVLHDLREEFPGMELQLLRADRVVGKEHLVFAAKNAIDSFSGRARRAKHLSMEFLLFASGEHQIIEAVKLLGITRSTTEIVLVGLSTAEPNLDSLTRTLEQETKGFRDDAVITIQNARKIMSIKKAYKITDRELESTKVPGEKEEMLLKRLVIERSAILVLEN